MTALTFQESYIIIIAHFVALMMFTVPLTLRVTVDLPPPKRRKTFAGSIASTALSAALIGTAVGLTVYRLWKGKGKQTEVPPPPYEQREWASSPSVGHGPKADEASGPHYVPVSQPDPCEYSEPSVTSSVQRRRQRHVAGRRSLPRQRRVHPRTQPTYPHAFNFSPPEHSAHVPVPQFNFDSANQSYEEEPEADTSDQMDWIGDKLAQLIEEGKRALGKEIVITAEAEEDEEDDGSGQWVEDDEGPIPSPSSGSFCKSHRPCDIAIVSPPPQYSSPWRTPRSPNSGRFDTISRPDSTYSSPRNRARADSVDSLGSILSSQHQEDGSAWQSPEMREAMERARQSYLQRGQMAS
ncbi:uncharacterized protein PHACADRAFT_264614 [Phanerochaete carnosa HHB-10118-sp]|uniref:Uncharacterized protein n=1 Tax=Phanerochaete carnosa (strain HHB-10118-sp) TaxID=650164 RepID=K5VFX9_PHACS|nr:uncharacterized protein PHACADRAFT_264614 [Phanerochaete carnosa HHB-10118-sp]EKM50088.1 hypothetical protein PHACADRAFT_264614 [Phanerochaete carnosa HHB-10118-sp]